MDIRAYRDRSFHNWYKREGLDNGTSSDLLSYNWYNRLAWDSLPACDHLSCIGDTTMDSDIDVKSGLAADSCNKREGLDNGTSSGLLCHNWNNRLAKDIPPSCDHLSCIEDTTLGSDIESESGLAADTCNRVIQVQDS